MNILVAYPKYPEPDMQSGDLRMFEILRILLDSGHQVTFLAERENNPRYREAVEALGTDCVSNTGGVISGSSQRTQAFLKERTFDVAIFSFYFIYNKYAPYIRTFLPDCKLILDTVDLHFLRLQREAELTGDPAASEKASKVAMAERSAIFDAGVVWVVTEAERTVIKNTFGEDLKVAVVPNVHRLADSIPGYEQREGVVFLGGYVHRPNVDAIHYFMRDILPLIRSKLPNVTFTIAGSNPPPQFRRYSRGDLRVIVTGFIPDHRALLTQHRIGIAPLRYGAGLKGKIGEYLACSLPTVTTPIGAEGMNLRHDREVLIAEKPAEFALEVVRLYDDPDLWSRISAVGPKYIERHFSPKAVTPLVLNGLALAQASDRSRPRQSLSRSLPSLSNSQVSPRPPRSFLNPRRVCQLLIHSIEAMKLGGTSEFRERFMAWARWNKT